MRRGAALFWVLLLIQVPSVQAETVSQELLTDSSGDVMVSTADGAVTQSDGGQFNDLDITAVGVEAEDPETITFYLEVQSLESSSQNPAPFSDPDYRIYFRSGEQGYRVRVDTSLQNPYNDALGRGGVFARLEQQVGEDQYRAIAEATAELAFGDNRVLATIPRGAVVDENQAALGRGRDIEGIYATSRSMGYFAFPVGQTSQGGEGLATVGMPAAWDQAPDDLAGLPAYTLVTGEEKQRGSIYSGSEDPVRWTNGEASTLSYTVSVVNTAEEDLPVMVGVDETDPTWTVVYSDSVTVPAGEAINVTFLVTIPFSHNHGAIDMFEAVFVSADEEHKTVTDLGVYWPAVPQPAGHHDKLWFHSLQEESDGGFFSAFDNGIHAWMSATEDEDMDEGIDVPSMFTLPPNQFTGGKAIAFWSIPLEPELRMGLDFRTEDLGTAEIALDFPSTVVDPSLTYRLRHVEIVEQQGRNAPRGESVVLAEAQHAVAGTVSNVQVFPLELTISDEADLIPYEQSSNLVVDLILEATFIAGFGNQDPAGLAPALSLDASYMQLPLNEYEEGTDLTFATDGNLEITAGPEGQQRKVNAGNTVVYTFEVAYHGSIASVFDARLTGTNVEWAEVVGDARFGIEGHETRRIGVAVTAPSGASDGETADLTLTVVDIDNAAVQAGINLKTVVDSKEEIPDESLRKDDLDAELTTDKESPGLPLIGLLAALALALRRR